MQHWTLLEIMAQLHADELERKGRKPSPLSPPSGGFRRRLARGLVGLGLRLDAEASRDVVGSFGTAPRLNSSDA